jgi:hypothetical protein
VEILLDFERKYEKIGIPALLLMVITGVWMSYQFGIGFFKLVSFFESYRNCDFLEIDFTSDNCIVCNQCKFFVIPKLTAKTLPLMAFHILSVTTIGVLMLLLGSFVRYGGLSF